MKKIIISLSLLFTVIFTSQAINPDSVRYKHQSTDTARITEVLNATRNAQLQSPADRITFIAGQFLGAPYVAATLEGEPEMLTVNTSEFDCTTFVETVIALALTAAVDSTTYLDFIDNLAALRYRNGVVDGYASRLHYVTDWIVCNSERNIFTEITNQNPRVAHKKISLNYMSKHRRSYPALASNNEAYNDILDVEKPFLNYNMPYIPKAAVGTPQCSKWLKNGDIVFITTSLQGLDVTHMGIIVFQRGMPYLLHASSKGKQVIVDPQPLSNYLQSNSNAIGIRVVRLN